MQTFLTIAEKICRRACEAYLAELQRAGIVAQFLELQPDFLLAGNEDAAVFRVEWDVAGNPADDESDDLNEDEPQSSASSCKIDLYRDTLQVLAANREAAAAFLARTQERSAQ